MFQILCDSKMTLNIHADSSPQFASNMRLFETTGVGTCLITDWKENLPELFVPDKEVVTYRNAQECAEKMKWLLDHPQERAEIAAAGMARTLREHTFMHRAVELDRIIRTALAKGRGR
jgi:spore maturation protein CgeB